MANGIRPFRYDDEDYRILERVGHSESPEQAETAEELAVWDEIARAQSDLFERFVLERDGVARAVATLIDPHWSKGSGKLNARVWALPGDDRAELLEQGFEHLFEIARSHQPKGLVSGYRSDDAEKRAYLERSGFSETMRWPVKRLDLENSNVHAFEPGRQRALAGGVTVRTYAQERDGRTDWLERAYELDKEVMADVPLPDPYNPMPFDKFCEFMQNPKAVDLDWFFVAIDEASGEYAGLTMLFPSKMEPDKAFTGLTGVRRQFRRRGIATALKLAAFDKARAHGRRFILTDNEENNPMGQLNRAMGFRDLFSQVAVERVPAF